METSQFTLFNQKVLGYTINWEGYAYRVLWFSGCNVGPFSEAWWKCEFCIVLWISVEASGCITQETSRPPGKRWQCETPYSLSNSGENSRTTVGTSWTSALQPGLGPWWLPYVWFAKKPPWWQAFPWWHRGWIGGAWVPETTVKILLCCGFQHTGKAIGQVYQCWSMICRERVVFSIFGNHIFYILYQFVTYLLTLPLNSTLSLNTPEVVAVPYQELKICSSLLYI
jgi:hypothetical protein